MVSSQPAFQLRLQPWPQQAQWQLCSCAEAMAAAIVFDSLSACGKSHGLPMDKPRNYRPAVVTMMQRSQRFRPQTTCNEQYLRSPTLTPKTPTPKLLVAQGVMCQLLQTLARSRFRRPLAVSPHDRRLRGHTSQSVRLTAFRQCQERCTCMSKWHNSCLGCHSRGASATYCTTSCTRFPAAVQWEV